MPRHNRPEIAEALRKRYDTDVPASFETIGPEIIPVILTEDLTATEKAVERYAQGYARQTAVAGEYSHVGLYNPAGSGVLIYPEYVLTSIDTTASLRLQRDGGLTNVASDFDLLDQRLAGNPVGQIRYQTDAGFLGQILALFTQGANDWRMMPLDKFVLAENDGINIGNSTANKLIDVSFVWREVNVQ